MTEFKVFEHDANWFNGTPFRYIGRIDAPDAAAALASVKAQKVCSSPSVQSVIEEPVRDVPRFWRNAQ